MGLPLLIFYDIFLSRSITLTETQTTSSCLWCVTGTSPQHVLPIAAHTCLGGREEEEWHVSFVFSLLSFKAVLWVTAVVRHTGTRQLYSKYKEVMLCKFGVWERNVSSRTCQFRLPGKNMSLTMCCCVGHNPTTRRITLSENDISQSVSHDISVTLKFNFQDQKVLL